MNTEAAVREALARGPLPGSALGSALVLLTGRTGNAPAVERMVDRGEVVKTGPDSHPVYDLKVRP